MTSALAGLQSSTQNILTSLQSASSDIAAVQKRLATGQRINSVVDGPSNYFAARDHKSRADQLDARKDGISEAMETIKAGLNGISGKEKLIEAARGILTQARSTTATADLDKLATQFDGLMDQIDAVADDANYKGVNLLASGTLSAKFNESGASSLTLTGFDGSSTGLGLAKVTDNTGVNTAAKLDALETKLNTAKDTLKSESAGMGANMTVLTTRHDFITDMTATLREGAAKLTEADMNSEAANLLALQTRQSLGVTALSMANQASQSVMRLF